MCLIKTERIDYIVQIMEPGKEWADLGVLSDLPCAENYVKRIKDGRTGGQWPRRVIRRATVDQVLG